MSGLAQFLEDLFIDPGCPPNNGYGYVQLIFLICVYALILMKASKLIADGSELLMLVMNPGLIGGLILPVMGAVPDGAIVLFSGLGPDAQQQLDVGMGTLAGSTIMLLTLPWAACILLGRVDLSDDGKMALYKQQPRLTKGMHLQKTGVQVTSEISLSARIMIGTGVTYLIVQGPAWANASDQHAVALVGFLCAALAFVVYSLYQVFSARAIDQQKAMITQARSKALGHKLVSVLTLMNIDKQMDNDVKLSGPALRKLFERWDTDKSGAIDSAEMRALLRELGLKLDATELKDLLRSIGGNDMTIQFEEFEALVDRCRNEALAHRNEATTSRKMVVQRADPRSRASMPDLPLDITMLEREAPFMLPTIRLVRHITDGLPIQADDSASQEAGAAGDDQGEEPEDEEEEEVASLTPNQIRFKALTTLAIGVGIITLFSDPMVNVLSEVGRRLNIPAFYISFVITPVVSNASEVISSVVFAGRKTQASITLTFSALLGAAAMNNTFCVAIFLALVYFQNLVWQYSAEVTSILIVEVAMCIMAMSSVSPTWKAIVIASLYPFSLILVYLLENVAGMS